MQKKYSKLVRIALFVLISFVVSNVFRFDLLSIQPHLQQLPPWAYVFSTALLEGSGVFIAAILCLKILRKKEPTTVTFLGNEPKTALWMALVPVVVVTIFGVKNTFGIQSNVYGLTAICASLAYCIFEETGWRNYLHEELKHLKPIVRYSIIGVIWYAWHLSFLTDASWSENGLFLGMLILGSWGIGHVAETTKSVLVCASFHLLVQLMLFNSLIKDGLSGNQKLTIIGICVVCWIAIAQWKKKKSGPNA